jgi:hypothetical protein
MIAANLRVMPDLPAAEVDIRHIPVVFASGPVANA